MSDQSAGERILARSLARELTDDEMSSMGGQGYTYYYTVMVPNGDYYVSADPN